MLIKDFVDKPSAFFLDWIFLLIFFDMQSILAVLLDNYAPTSTVKLTYFGSFQTWQNNLTYVKFELCKINPGPQRPCMGPRENGKV